MKYHFQTTTDQRELNLKTRITIFSIYSLVLIAFVCLSIRSYNYELNTYLQKKTSNLQIAYEKVVDTYSIPAKLIFDLEINNDKILGLLFETLNADSVELHVQRKQLYKELIDPYNKLIKHNYRQLHFHLPDNRSFLRFHHPEKYGDDLTDIRSSVRNTNKKITYSQGFEGGKILSAFRYVFPLQHKDKHLGSVEFSVSYIGILSKIEENYDIICNFLISKEAIHKKVPESELYHYLACQANSKFYVEKEGHEEIRKKTLHDLPFPKIFKEFYANPEAKKLFDSFESGSLITEINNKDFVVTILRILNFEDEPVAYIAAIEKDQEKRSIYYAHLLTGAIRIILLLMFLTLLIVTFLKNRQLRSAKEKLKVLDGLLPICSYCKKIRDDEGHWDPVESYIDKKSEAKFSHSVCPDCAKEYFGSYLHKTK